MEKRIFLNGLDTSKSDWLRLQNSMIDRFLGSMDIKDFGIKKGRAYVVIDEPNEQKLSGLDYEIEADYISLFIEFSGGDGKYPIGIENNGTDTIEFTLTLNDKDGNIVDFSGDKRITIKTVQTNEIYDVILVNFISGVSSFSYATQGKTAICKISGESMGIIIVSGIDYNVEVAKEVIFKIYRLM